MAIKTYGAPDAQRTTTLAYAELLKRTGPKLVLDRYCLQRKVPKNKNQSITFRRAVNGAVSTTTLTEGAAPTAQAINYEDVAVSLGEYGLLYEVSSVARELGEDNYIKDSADVMSDQMANTREAVGWAAFIAGTNVYYAATADAARTDVNTAVVAGRLQEVVRQLKRQKADMFTEIHHGGVNENTFPVEASYIALCHTDLEPDLRALSGFVTVSEYGGRKPSSEYEFGTFQNIAFVTTPQLDPIADAGGTAGGSFISTSGTDCDVYPILIIGKEALGCVALRGSGKKGFGAIEMNVLSNADKSDPLNQKTSIGCRWYDAKVILNQSWCARLEVAASAL